MSDSSVGAKGGAPLCLLPRGARDLLPAACRRRRAITHTLLSTFEAWGYEPVATPAIEHYEVLSRGLSEADRRGCVRFIAAGSGDLVTLRADVTPQIARMLAQRWGGELSDDVVHRFSYAAEVLRQPTTAREQTEVHQVGIELIGDSDPAADAELTALAHAALRSVGLGDFRLDLTHTRLTRGLLAALELPDEAAAKVHARLARKDRDGLARVLAPFDRPAALRQAAVALCELFGEPDQVLSRAEASLRGAGVDDALAELSRVLEHLRRMDDEVLSRVTVDLGEARGFDYYSGIRVRGWARGVHHPLVRGGRYDGLPRRYGVPRPATGLAIDLDAVEAALHAQDESVVGAEPGPAHLVVVASADDADARGRAHAVAARARASGRRAWVQPGLSLPRAQALAEASGADRLTIVDERGRTQWSFESRSWALEEETT